MIAATSATPSHSEETGRPEENMTAERLYHRRIIRGRAAVRLSFPATASRPRISRVASVKHHQRVARLARRRGLAGEDAPDVGEDHATIMLVCSTAQKRATGSFIAAPKSFMIAAVVGDSAK